MANYLEEIEQLSLSVDDLIDSESPIIIDTLTRNLIIQSNFNKQIAVEGDLSANEITFICDRYIEGYDVFSADSAYIIWNNKAAGTEDAYLVTDRELDADTFKFSWLISREVAKKAGAIECSVCFIDYADTERTIVSYKWASNPLFDLTVGTGVPNASIDNQDFIEEIDSTRDVATPELKQAVTDSEGSIECSMLNRDFVFSENINKQVAVEGDSYANIITFNIAKGSVDYDLNKASLLLVKWEINQTSDYSVLQITENNTDTTVCKWILPPRLAKKAGGLTFSLCFITADNDKKIVSKWNSNPCSVLSVGNGISNSKIDGAETIDFVNDPITQEELNNILEGVFDGSIPFSEVILQEDLSKMLKEVFQI